MNNLLTDEWAEQWLSFEFREKVAVEIYQANIRASAIVADSPDEFREFIRKDVEDRKLRAERSSKGKCAGCGCSHDEQTEGCFNCRARYSARAKYERDKKRKAEEPKGTCCFCLREVPIVDGIIRCIRCGDGAAYWKSHIKAVIEGR